MSKADEQILVIKRADVFENESLAFQGIVTEKEDVQKILNNLNKGLLVKRRGDKTEEKSEDNMEANPEYKQPIPYIIVKQDGKYFAYKRLKGGGEKRLFDKVSIGVGGHMNNIMGINFHEELKANAQRELNEELKFTIDGNETEIKIDDESLDVVGIINDDENEVGQVHLGVAIVINFDKKFEITVRETDTLDGEFLTTAQLKKHYKKLESWSQIIFDELK